MSKVTTTRKIDLPRLDAELGNVGLHMTGDGDSNGSKTISAPGVGETTLQAAVDAHVWIDSDVQAAADEKAWRDAVTAASSIADIKALLLGTNTPVRPVVDRKP